MYPAIGAPSGQDLGVENIVAIAVALETGDERFFITWGRIQDTVDEGELLALVLRHSTTFSLGGVPTSARACVTLQEASNEPYFYEALFDFGQQRIPEGRRYNHWRRRIAAEMEQGKHLWYLGR